MGGKLDLVSLLDLVGEQVRAIFKADVAYVALLDQRRGQNRLSLSVRRRDQTAQLGEGLDQPNHPISRPLIISGKDRRDLGARSQWSAGEAFPPRCADIGDGRRRRDQRQSTHTERVRRRPAIAGTIAANVGVALQNARLFQEAKEARAAAEAANEAKSSFLATMSHEIRTPMNAVLGMSGFCSIPAQPEQRDYATTIRDSGDALLTIINDILDFSKIEAGRMDIEHPFDLRDCVESALDLVSARAAEKHLDTAYLFEGDVPRR
jgi:signal transduction histidine kinase